MKKTKPQEQRWVEVKKVDYDLQLSQVTTDDLSSSIGVTEPIDTLPNLKELPELLQNI